MRFPGQYYDVEKASNYNYFRDYDPAIGRYVESDPIGPIDADAARFFNANRQNRAIRNWLLADGEKSWSSSNLFSYVRSRPLGAIDPLGLWSVSLGGYSGVGGEIVIGRNPDGKWFGSGRVGYGFGGGGSYDPNGTGPGAEKCECTWNSAFGGYGYFQAGLGPFFAGQGTNGGMIMNSRCGGPTGYFEVQPFNYGLDAGIRLRFGAAAGFEVTLY
jgi:RHS repeat-associated protein